MTQVTAVPVTAESELRAQVTDFYSRQMRLLDDGDAEAWAATFTADGTFIASGHQHPTTGRAGLIAAVRATHAELAASGIVHRHWLGMIIVDQRTDGTVHARSYALVHRSTTCDDVLVRAGAGFAVQSRSVTRDDFS